MTESMQKHLAYFTHEATEAGHLYYFAPADQAPGPYLKQIHVNAIIDVAADGTLAGVELIDGMPPPPTRRVASGAEMIAAMADEEFNADRSGENPTCGKYTDADALRDLQESILQSTTISDFMAVKKTVEAIREAENDRA